jgi:Ca2+-binding EF-hand superfamily protein
MFRPTTLLLSLAVSASALAEAPSAAHTHRDWFSKMLQSMDTNGDGRISRDEYLAAATTRFRTIDAQNSGSVDAADIASSPAALERIDRRAQAFVNRLDTAGNGYVTLDEFVAGAQNRFERLDADHDGRLTPDEFAAHGHRGQGPRGAGQKSAFARRHFDRLDTNGDGAVSLDEYVAGARALYAKLDTQHDGKVTADSLADSPRAENRAVRVADRIVRHMDSNDDGRVSADEFLAAAQGRFARLDRNGDGFIDGNEIGGRRHD